MSRMTAVRKPVDQPCDAVAQLQRKVGGGGAHQLTDIVDRHLAPGAQPVWVLCLAQVLKVPSRCR